MKTYSPIYLLIPFLLCGCFVNSKCQVKDKESKLLEEWKKDTLGCLKYRTKEKALYIRDSLDLKNKSTIFVINKLGTPNSIKKDSNREILKYYFNTICRENVFIASFDYCWIEMLVESDRVKNIEVSCN
jgi:hypothetical protein